MSSLDGFLIPEPDARASAAATARHERLTKPAGSLGRLESLVACVAGWQADPLPRAREAAAVLFAADHAVTRHGVSAYPREVTRAMLSNFETGGAAASVLAKRLCIPLQVVDVGVDGGDATEGVIRDPVAGEAEGDIRVEDAMSPAVLEMALDAGVSAVGRVADQTRVLILGEMGIGNTTHAAAVCAALEGGDAEEWVGAGTGVAGPELDNKRRVVRDVVARLAGECAPDEVLRRAGSREIAAMAGAMAAGAARRMTVMVDGFIATAAAMVLVKAEPRVRPALVFGHRSHEQAHHRALASLDAEPLLDLSMRLGEGTGALLAFPILELACALHAEMATFESSGVPDR